MKEKKREEGVHFKTYGYTRTNLWILLASIVVIVLGYILMSGGGSTDPDRFNEEVFNARRIQVAPMLVTIGYLGILVAIFWRDKKRKSRNTEMVA